MIDQKVQETKHDAEGDKPEMPNQGISKHTEI